MEEGMSARIGAIIKPELLVWARSEAGYSIETVANKIKVDINKLRKWEKGELYPTINQLRKLAVLYKRPLSVFYLPKPPKMFQPLKDFRRFPDQKQMPLSPNLLYEMRLARERRQIALNILDIIDEEPPTLKPNIKLARDPENVAEDMRKLLNVSIEDQIKWPGYYAAFNNWRKALEQIGLLVFQAPSIPTKEMRGFSISLSPLPVIVTNTNDWIGARIFSLFHEFVHILRNEGGLCDFSDSGNRSPLEQEAEVFCNHVAGAILVPAANLLSEPIVKSNRRAPSWEDVDLRLLSKRYKVSREVILRRLLILGQIAKDLYLSKREEYQIEAKPRKKKEELKIPYHIKILARTGRSYAQLVLTSYYREKITSSDVSDYLGVKLNHISKIETELFQSSSF
jgi:Zn-dependent peptidase ImmA (M78 family)/DNA-binding XRE family transcriptional regulator